LVSGGILYGFALAADGTHFVPVLLKERVLARVGKGSAKSMQAKAAIDIWPNTEPELGVASD
jgi:hypothetical protein